MVITYENATQEDISAIYQFNKDLIDSYENISEINYDNVLDWVKRKIEGHIGEYRCIYSDGLKAGYVYVHPNGGETEIDDLYIFPEYRNRSIGTRVIENCKEEFGPPIMLYVFQRNTRAFSLYLRLGFKVSETIGTSRYVMRWEG